VKEAESPRGCPRAGYPPARSIAYRAGVFKPHRGSPGPALERPPLAHDRAEKQASATGSFFCQAVQEQLAFLWSDRNC